LLAQERFSDGACLLIISALFNVLCLRNERKLQLIICWTRCRYWLCGHCVLLCFFVNFNFSWCVVPV